jgi:predicted ribosomally synthesized peptide with nif11-like leader
MSIENAKAFFQRMNEDVDFRTIFESALTFKEHQQLIQDTGYDFTADEWQSAVTEIQSDVCNEELKEEELEAIAGGASNRGGVAKYGSVSPSYDEDGHYVGK